MQRKITSHYFLLNRLGSCFSRYHFFSSQNSPDLSVVTQDPIYADVPKPNKNKGERKPYRTPINILIQRAKLEKIARKENPCRMLEHPPENGLLVPELVEVAHCVYRAQQSLLPGLEKLVKAIPVQKCSKDLLYRFCSEVHIGHMGHEIRTCTAPGSGSRNGTHVWRRGRVHDVVFFPKCYHLYDRVGKPRVGHDEKRSVPRIPAILELCIQAGVNLEKYPSKRRTKPVYSIEGRIVDFEQAVEKYEMEKKLELVVDSGFQIKSDEVSPNLNLEKNICHMNESNGPINLRYLSIRTMESWFEMISGAKKIMDRYSVLTCGYCPEVQVGPKGHKVRMCKATKHQARDGQHAWQEATLEDLVGPNYVWHVEDPNGPPLDNKLRRYYGKAPAVVELCVQNGAPVPDQYRSMMRLDVVSPDRDEVDLVA